MYVVNRVGLTKMKLRKEMKINDKKVLKFCKCFMLSFFHSYSPNLPQPGHHKRDAGAPCLRMSKHIFCGVDRASLGTVRRPGLEPGRCTLCCRRCRFPRGLPSTGSHL